MKREPKFHNMAEDVWSGERIEDAEYVRGNAFDECNAEIKRDYIRSPSLKRRLRRAKRQIRLFR